MTENVRTATGVVVLLCASFVLLLASAPRTAAFEGPFCSEELRAEHEGCASVERESIRRAIGHTIDAYTDVVIETGQESALGSCRTIECEANTGYLAKDGKGHGYVYNEGPNGSRRVSGYLYP